MAFDLKDVNFAVVKNPRYVRKGLFYSYFRIEHMFGIVVRIKKAKAYTF